MKRIIFALLYRDGTYVLSRNFRLQRIGNISWVLNNYGILDVSQGIDELMILDVSAGSRTREQFRHEVAILAEECFVPVTVGGGISTVDEADRLFSCGADKILVNTALARDPQLVVDLTTKFGGQAVVASVDVSSDVTHVPEARRGLVVDRAKYGERIRAAIALGVGEVCIQSVDRDGTGSGLDLELAPEAMADAIRIPLMLMGGVGRAEHFLLGLQTPAVDAVVTANLLNFVGDALVRARQTVIEAGIEMPAWSSAALRHLRSGFNLTRADAAGSVQVASDA
jgi:cyclase